MATTTLHRARIASINSLKGGGGAARKRCGNHNTKVNGRVKGGGRDEQIF